MERGPYSCPALDVSAKVYALTPLLSPDMRRVIFHQNVRSVFKVSIGDELRAENSVRNVGFALCCALLRWTKLYRDDTTSLCFVILLPSLLASSSTALRGQWQFSLRRQWGWYLVASLRTTLFLRIVPPHPKDTRAHIHKACRQEVKDRRDVIMLCWFQWDMTFR